MLNQMFDRYRCEHWSGYENLPNDIDGVVMVIHGGNEQLNGTGVSVAAVINRQVEHFDWCIFVVIGDEASEFPVHLLHHPNSRLWIQTPKPGVSKGDRYFPVGYPGDCQELLARWPNARKDKDWFFAGQVTHERRWQLELALDRLGNGMFYPTKGFGQGLVHPEYYRLLAQAMVVPCPAGPATPCSYRVFETLEAGGVPVLDAFSPNHLEGYWDMVIPGHPFEAVKDWKDFPQILRRIVSPESEYAAQQRRAQLFWREYKQKFSLWLGLDLLELGVYHEAMD